jgi:hypothetical protein
VQAAVIAHPQAAPTCLVSTSTLAHFHQMRAHCNRAAEARRRQAGRQALPGHLQVAKELVQLQHSRGQALVHSRRRPWQRSGLQCLQNSIRWHQQSTICWALVHQATLRLPRMSCRMPAAWRQLSSLWSHHSSKWMTTQHPHQQHKPHRSSRLWPPAQIWQTGAVLVVRLVQPSQVVQARGRLSSQAQIYWEPRTRAKAWQMLTI